MKELWHSLSEICRISIVYIVGEIVVRGIIFLYFVATSCSIPTCLSKILKVGYRHMLFRDVGNLILFNLTVTVKVRSHEVEFSVLTINIDEINSLSANACCADVRYGTVFILYLFYTKYFNSQIIFTRLFLM